jgi:hypothetical protein
MHKRRAMEAISERGSRIDLRVQRALQVMHGFAQRTGVTSLLGTADEGPTLAEERAGFEQMTQETDWTSPADREVNEVTLAASLCPHGYLELVRR